MGEAAACVRVPVAPLMALMGFLRLFLASLSAHLSLLPYSGGGAGGWANTCDVLQAEPQRKLPAHIKARGTWQGTSSICASRRPHQPYENASERDRQGPPKSVS